MEKQVFLFPLNQTITLPKVVLPYHIFEPRYRAMIHAAVKTKTPVSVLPQRPEGDYVGRVCYAGVPTILRTHDDGRMDISLTGEVRCRLTQFISENPYKVFSYLPEEEDKTLSSKSEFARECIYEALAGWAVKSLVEKDQQQAFRHVINDPETLMNYATLFLVQNENTKLMILEERKWDERARILVKEIGPKEISLGPYMPPIRWK
ncbi:MAG: LON peptidase substrate-binding domain-containing protein [Bacteriovoracaceae bacterium]|nr:LON peptidase substrate-binding domain-containing protein [Bacteriovoracaceae bacterium]